MRKILLRADDLGYSKAVNYGIYESVVHGVINNVGVMVNMPATQMGLDLLKGQPIDLGLHTVICAGKPLLPAKQVPSLVDEAGNFKVSRLYRQNQGADFVVLDEVVAEIEAQYQRFVALTGRKPDYFEGHAVASENFAKGLAIVAKRHDLPLLAMPKQIGAAQSFKQATKFNFIMESMQDDYDPLAMLKRAVVLATPAIPMLVFHPGYLDQEILTQSSLTVNRTKEVQMLTSPATKVLLQDVKCLRYSQCQ